MAKQPTVPLKITCELYDGRVNSSDGLFFLDSILYHAWFLKNNPDVMFGTKLEGNPGYFGLPLRQDSPNRWRASIGQYKLHEENVEYWVKRPDFSKEYAENYIDKEIGKVNISAGPFKAYRTPQIIKIISDIIFYAMAKKTEIEELLSYINCIGKKTSMGWGTVENWIVEECEADYSTIKDGLLMRPMPLSDVDDEFKHQIDLSKCQIRSCGIRPPYWKYKNQEVCYVPEVGGNE